MTESEAETKCTVIVEKAENSPRAAASVIIPCEEITVSDSFHIELIRLKLGLI